MRAGLSEPLLTLISVFIFFGAVGKSAQIPLHVWLPDAMEGPTPVSALIHAATMVAGGVYLVARSAVLFTPASWQVVLAIGLLTHLFAGTVALTMTDIKRVLAYSTISQLGLMMTALGMGAVSAAMFHLFTHAFFKALLFLAAGSVIHATHQQDLSHLGGLWRRMPWTAAVFLIASLSMSGLMFLSGFWSKDAILLAAQQGHPWLLWALLGGAVLTSSYIFRLYLCCFHGPAHGVVGHDHQAHESPLIMVAPMLVLAVGAAFAGWAGSPWLGQPLLRLLGQAHTHESLDLGIAAWSSVAFAAGIGLAWWVGVRHRQLLPGWLQPLGHRWYRWAAYRYGVDEWYQHYVIAPFLAAADALSRFDGRVVDGAVNGVGRAGWWLGQWKERFDRLIVDGVVNGVAAMIRRLGESLRRIQTGVIHQYLLVIVSAAVALTVILQFISVQSR